MSSMKPPEWGMLILLSIFWGGSFFFVEIALHDFQPFTLVFLRVTLAAAGATNVLLVTFLIPISALLLGVGVLGEVIKVLEYLGMGCIFLGLIIIDGRALKWIKNYGTIIPIKIISAPVDIPLQTVKNSGPIERKAVQD